MKISDILAGGRPAVSFEVFPPRKDAPFAPVKEAVERLARQRPSFMSVTYGASGNAQANTVAIASFVQSCGVPALAHLTCVAATPESISGEVASLREAGIENVLCLRGDLPNGAEGTPPGCFRHAVDLVRVLRESRFCLGGACYPECHPECAHMEDDILHLREKVEAGLDFVTTQMFFDNNIFYRYLSKLRDRGVTVPVIAGIMPVTNGGQIARICRISGTYLPSRFKAIVDRFGDRPRAMLDAGVAYATEQIIDLFANGVNAVHIYTMNKPEVAERIMANLRGIVDDRCPPLSINLRDVSLYLRMGGREPDAALAARMAAMREAALEAISPARAWMRVELTHQIVTGWLATSRTLARHLAGCHAAYLVCGTLGAGFDALMRRTSVKSAADALVLQAVGTATIEEWMDAVEAEVVADLSEGEAALQRYSPGYGDFPLAAQRDLLGALETARRIGVFLTDTLLMVPSKSVSAVIGVKQEAPKQ